MPRWGGRRDVVDLVSSRGLYSRKPRRAKMRLIASLAVLLALATPANARFYTFWRCGEVAVHMVDNQERKAFAISDPARAKRDTWSITFEGIRHTTLDRRGLKFRVTRDGFALNERPCETMSDEEWEKLHPTEK